MFSFYQRSGCSKHDFFLGLSLFWHFCHRVLICDELSWLLPHVAEECSLCDPLVLPGFLFWFGVWVTNVCLITERVCSGLYGFTTVSLSCVTNSLQAVSKEVCISFFVNLRRLILQPATGLCIISLHKILFVLWWSNRCEEITRNPQ